MRHNCLRLLFSCSIFIILSACTKDMDNGLEGDGFPIGVMNNGQDVVQGIMRVKLVPESESRISLFVNDNGIAQTGLEELDNFAMKIGATKIERTFNRGGKFEKRRREAGLHLWYTIYYDEKSTEQTRAYRNTRIEGIDLMEPVYTVKQGSGNAIRKANAGLSNETKNTIYTLSLENPFNDPYLDRQWHYQNDGSLGTNFIRGADINLFAAWEIITGSKNVIVAIMDSGIDFDHEDLAANMWVNKSELNGSDDADDDDNGYVDDIYGWNFVYDTKQIVAGDHGTHVAGIIGAVNNNGVGICGIGGGDGSGNGVRIMSCQITATDQTSYEISMPDAFAYAADNGAVISQNSWGYGRSVTALPEADKVAIDYFIKYAGINENGEQTGPLKGGVVIFAAGNYYTEGVVYPAAYNQTVAVAAMASDFTRASYSSYGTWVDITAPGGNNVLSPNTVYSTLPNNSYGYMEGTSQACPHVSGVAALLVAKYGTVYSNITGNDIRQILENTSNDIYGYNPSLGGKLGKGYVDAFRALTESDDASSIPASPSIEFECYNKLIYMSVTVEKNSSGFIPNRYEVFYAPRQLTTEDINNPPSDVTTLTIYTNNAQRGDKMTYDFSDLIPDTKYHVVINTHNLMGSNTATQSYETTTKNVNPPDKVNDFSISWGGESALITWRVTSDPDNGRPVHYNIYYSKENLSTLDWKNTSAPIYTLKMPVLNYAVGNRMSTQITNLSANTMYYFAIQGVDIYTNESDLAYYVLYTGINSAPVLIKKLPALSFSAKGETVSLNMTDYFSYNGPLGLTYALTTSPSGYLNYAVTGDEMVITSMDILNGTGRYSITATDYFGLTASDTADFMSNSNSTFSMYPNPVSTVLTISLPYYSSGEANIRIYNTAGTCVMDASQQVGTSVTITVDMRKLSSGIYTVVVKCNHNEAKRTITKL